MRAVENDEKARFGGGSGGGSFPADHSTPCKSRHSAISKQTFEVYAVSERPWQVSSKAEWRRLAVKDNMRNASVFLKKSCCQVFN